MNRIDAKTWAAFLRGVMDRRKLSRGGLARLLGMNITRFYHNSTIDHWLTGKVRPTGVYVEFVCGKLGERP